MLYREPKLLKAVLQTLACSPEIVSVLYREPKLLKGAAQARTTIRALVSVLYREPKLLKAVRCDSEHKGT